MKLKTSRRGILKAALSAGALSTASIPFAKNAHASESAGLEGRLIGIGTEVVIAPETHPSDPSRSSAIIDLDIKTGEVKYHTTYNTLSGHSIIRLPDGRYFCVSYGHPSIFMDSDFNVVGEITPPEGYMLGGHAALMPDGKTIVTHFNRIPPNRQTPEGTGMLCAIDAEEMKISKTIPSKILNAHYVMVLSDNKHFVIADDGDLSNSDSDIDKRTGELKRPYMYKLHDPALYIYKISDLTLARKVPMDINGTFVHLEEGLEKKIYGVIEQGITNTPEGRALLGKRTEPIRATSLYKTAFPSPMVEYDYKSNNVRKALVNKDAQIRSFDIRFNEKTDYMISSYTDSHYLGRHSPNMENFDFFSTLEFGIEEPYGLINIPNTPYMAVNGFNTGIAIFDTRNMKMIRKFNIETFGMKHLLHVA